MNFPRISWYRSDNRIKFDENSKIELVFSPSFAWFDILGKIRMKISRYKLQWELNGKYVASSDDYPDSYVIYSSESGRINVEEFNKYDGRQPYVEKEVIKENKFTVIDNFKIYKYE
jgi:hypothetical protein